MKEVLTAPPGFDPADIAPPRQMMAEYPLLSLAPDVAGTCNMACRYCAEAASQPSRSPMSAEVFNQLWEYLFSDDSIERRRSIRFGSGEPLCGLDRLRQLHEKIKEYQEQTGKEGPDISVTTNGLLLDDATADWLATTGWSIKVSIDGNSEYHDNLRLDRHGKGTYQRSVAALNRLLDRCPKRTSVAAVLCRGMDPANVFSSLEELGVTKIELVPLATRDPELQPTTEDLVAYTEFINAFTSSLIRDGLRSRSTLVRFESCARRVMGYDVQAVRCGAGRNFLGVSPDGDLYPCFRFVGVSEFRLGDLSSGLDRSRVMNFMDEVGRSYYARSSCESCWAAPLCGGPCFSCAEFFGNGEPIESHCFYVRTDGHAAVRLVEELRQADASKLLDLLPADFEIPW